MNLRVFLFKYNIRAGALLKSELWPTLLTDFI